MMLPRFLNRFTLSCCFVFVLCAFSYFKFKNCIDFAALGRSQDLCAAFPNPGGIVVTLKTGATASNARIPSALRTSLRCVRDPIIVSDLEQRLDGHVVYDILANVTPRVMEGNREFDLYRLQQEYVQTGRESEIPSLSAMPYPQENWASEDHNAAWALDKYKFLYEVQFAWEMAPYQDWYLFLEGDTYLSWGNFLRWLPTMNPKEKHYLASALRIWERPDGLHFGHGGSGILLSGATVKEFAVDNAGLPQRWDERVKNEVLGDLILALALDKDLHLRVKNTFPWQCQEDPEYMVFRDDFWCQPVVSLHHMKPDQQQRVFDFEVRNIGRPLLYGDLYHLEGLEETLSPIRHDWDNGAGDIYFRLDPTADKIMDQEACAAACERNQECLQYSVVLESETSDEGSTKSLCYHSSVYRRGKAQEPMTKVREAKHQNYTSGWMVDRIKAMAAKHESCERQALPWPS